VSLRNHPIKEQTFIRALVISQIWRKEKIWEKKGKENLKKKRNYKETTWSLRKREKRIKENVKKKVKRIIFNDSRCNRKEKRLSLIWQFYGHKPMKFIHMEIAHLSIWYVNSLKHKLYLKWREINLSFSRKLTRRNENRSMFNTRLSRGNGCSSNVIS